MIKTRLSVAVLAATLTLVGCIGDDEEQKVVTESYVGFDPIVAAADNANLPAAQQRGPVIPFPFDALFAGAKTPTLNIPNAGNVTFVGQANLQDGFSTTASWFVDIFGLVDLNTVADINPLSSNLMIINSVTGKPLVYKTDFDIQTSTVKDASGIPISLQRTRLLIEPLKPLAPNTTYIVVLKKGIKTKNGGTVQPSYMFNFLNSDTKITDRTDSYFKRFSAAEKATLETLRTQLVRKTVNTLKAIPPLGITDTNVLLAYSITTQSTTKTLDKVAAATVASDIAAVPIGQTVKQVLEAVGQAAPPNAEQTDVYVGTLKVPYYGDVTSVAKPTAILSSYWKADATKPDVAAKVTPFQIPCGAYATGATLPDGQTATPSISTTTCFPEPVKQSDQTIPMIVTVPKGAKPEGGWPVVIFQHGITRNRTDVFAIASSFAAANHITVAIDLPLHGLPASNPFYKNQLLAPTPAAGLMTNNERTFDADFVNNSSSAAGPDGQVDSSGTHFVNLASPITSRDNIRQGAADILVLAKSLANLNVDGVAGGDVDTSKIRFAGISLGSIVGTVALGADKGTTIGAASLSVGGGGIPKLLDASKSFGPVIAAGLQGSGVLENTDSYETFMRFAQTLTDSADPVSFAVAAKTNRAIHFTEVLNDLVVPNQAMAGAASATQDFVGISGLLSGTDALARVMNFALADRKTLDMATLTKTNVSGSTWVLFNQGAHGSLLDPTSNAAVTVEMQCQTVNFLASNGTFLPLGCSKPAEMTEVAAAE